MIRTGTLAILPAGAVDYLQAARRRTRAAAPVRSPAWCCFSPSPASIPAIRRSTMRPAAEPLNLLGRPGAFVADLLLHGFGWAALVPVLGFFGWAWRLLGKRPMRRLGLQAAGAGCWRWCCWRGAGGGAGAAGLAAGRRARAAPSACWRWARWQRDRRRRCRSRVAMALLALPPASSRSASAWASRWPTGGCCARTHAAAGVAPAASAAAPAAPAVAGALDGAQRAGRGSQRPDRRSGRPATARHAEAAAGAPRGRSAASSTWSSRSRRGREPGRKAEEAAQGQLDLRNRRDATACRRSTCCSCRRRCRRSTPSAAARWSRTRRC